MVDKALRQFLERNEVQFLFLDFSALYRKYAVVQNLLSCIHLVVQHGKYAHGLVFSTHNNSVWLMADGTNYRTARF